MRLVKHKEFHHISGISTFLFGFYKMPVQNLDSTCSSTSLMSSITGNELRSEEEARKNSPAPARNHRKLIQVRIITQLRVTRTFFEPRFGLQDVGAARVLQDHPQRRSIAVTASRLAQHLDTPSVCNLTAVVVARPAAAISCAPKQSAGGQ